MTWVSLGLLCKSQLSVLDCCDNGISNFDEPHNLDSTLPLWDLSSRCAGRHTPKVETVIQIMKAQAGCTLFAEVEFLEIDDFFKSIKKGIGDM